MQLCSSKLTWAEWTEFPYTPSPRSIFSQLIHKDGNRVLINLTVFALVSQFLLQVSYPLISGVKKGAGKERGILSEAQHRAYLDRHPYKEYQQEELQYAK